MDTQKQNMENNGFQFYVRSETKKNKEIRAMMHWMAFVSVSARAKSHAEIVEISEIVSISIP